MNTELTNSDLAPDATLHIIDGAEHVVLDRAEGGTEVYQIVGKTTNARSLWTADAVIYEGDVLYPELDTIGRIALVHNWAGTKASFLPREWLDAPALKLSKVPTKSKQ